MFLWESKAVASLALSTRLNRKVRAVLYKKKIIVKIVEECSMVLIFHEACNWEVRSMKASSLHGIVRPPIGWLNPNSSSARLSRSWKEGWFKKDMGTTNRFLWISPTYTVMWPFGTSEWFLVCRECSLRRCLALRTMDGRRIPITNTIGVKTESGCRWDLIRTRSGSCW